MLTDVVYVRGVDERRPTSLLEVARATNAVGRHPRVVGVRPLHKGCFALRLRTGMSLLGLRKAVGLELFYLGTETTSLRAGGREYCGGHLRARKSVLSAHLVY